MKDNYYIILVIVVLLIAIFVLNSLKIINKDYTEYVKDYSEKIVLIKKESGNLFWDEIENSIINECDNKSVALEILEPDNTNLLFQNELLEMAITTKPDGIILSGYNSNEMLDLLNLASKKGIPVIFISDEGINSLRKAYVGPNNYQVGQKAIQEITKNNNKKYNALILDEYGKKNKNLLVDGMLSEININDNIELSMIKTSGEYRYELENKIRNLITENNDINLIIGPNTYEGAIIASLLVKMNKVGEIEIIAFDNSKETLEYIKKGVISVGIYTDGNIIGKKAVNTLMTINRNDFSLDVYYTPIQIITNENIDFFIEGDTNEE